MRMSCGRSDGKLTNQAKESPRAYASPRQRSRRVLHYNRLESGGEFRLLYASACPSVRSLPLAAKPQRRVVDAAFSRVSVAPRTFLSPPQGRESCHTQIWGVTPFRRGTA